jgi:hypothetical protein
MECRVVSIRETARVKAPAAAEELAVDQLPDVGFSPDRWGNRPAACGWLKVLGAALQADGGNEVRGAGLKHQKRREADIHTPCDRTEI